MAAKDNAIGKAVELAAGCVLFAAAGGLAAGVPAMVGVAVPGVALVLNLSSFFRKHGLESRKVLRNVRQQVRDRHEAQVATPAEQFELDETCQALAEHLDSCTLDRQALAEASFDAEGFPNRATALILGALAKASPRHFGPDAPAVGLAYTRDVIATSLRAVVESPDYYAVLKPVLTLEQNRVLAQIRSGIEALGQQMDAGFNRAAAQMTAETDRTIAAVSALTPALQEAVAKAVQAALGGQADAAVQDELTVRLAGLFGSDLPAKREAAGLVQAGDTEGAANRLEALARQQSEALGAVRAQTAETWRELGALRLGSDVTAAIDAYEQAWALEPTDAWTAVFLSRLHLSAGDPARARHVVEAAMAAADADEDRSALFECLCEISLAQADLTAARDAVDAGLAINLAASRRDPTDGHAAHHLSISYERLSEVAQLAGDIEAAYSAIDQAVTLRETLAARDPGDMRWRRALWVAYHRLGDVSRMRGDLDGARRAYGDALGIAFDLSSRDPENLELARDLGAGFERAGRLALFEGDLVAARASFDASLAIARDLVGQDPSNAEWRHDLSICLQNVGDVARAEGDPGAARSAYVEMLGICEALANSEDAASRWRRALSVALIKLGELDEEAGDFGAARGRFRDSLRIAEDLARRDPGNTLWTRDVSIGHERIGDLAMAADDLGEAREAFRASLEIAAGLAELDPNNIEWLRDLATAHARVGDAALMAEDFAAAGQAYRASLDIDIDLAARLPEAGGLHRRISKGYRRMGLVAEATGAYEEAISFYNDGLASLNRLLELDPGDAALQADLTGIQGRIDAAKVRMAG